MKGPRRLRARPTCAVCRRPVDDFTEEDGTGALAGFVLFVARCHGAVDRQKVRRSLTKGLNFGAAFVPENVLPSHPERRALPEMPDLEVRHVNSDLRTSPKGPGLGLRPGPGRTADGPPCPTPSLERWWSR